MSSSCIDLHAAFPGHKLGWDPAREGRSMDPWLRTLKCKFGMIYPWGGSRLGLDLDGHPGIVRRLKTIPGVETWTEGEKEATLLFHVKDFDQVAAIVKPRRKKRISPEHLAALRGRRRALVAEPAEGSGALPESMVGQRATLAR